MDFKFFFNLAKEALLLVDSVGNILAANKVANKHSLATDKNLFSLLIASELEKLKILLEDLKNGSQSNESFQIEFSCFPEMLSRSRWKIFFLQEQNLFAFCCEELSQYSSEDFLLHTGLMKIIFDNDPNLIAIVNRVGLYLFANKAIYDFAGIKEGKNIETLNHLLQEKELWLPGTEKLVSKDDEKVSEIELTTDPLGNAAWFENIRVPIKMPYGEDVLLIISKDVTNWKLSEKRLVDHQQALFHSNRLSYLGEMAGQIAHEINNPLTIILGNSQILKKNLRQDEKEENELLIKSIEKIEFMVDRISKLIKMMRSLAKNNAILPQTKSKVSDIIQSVFSTLTDKFKAYEIETNLQINQIKNDEIFCYPTELSQVILNILLNSIDSIILSKKNSSRKIELKLYEEKENIIIQISNTGEQIPEEIKDRIFEPFFTTKPVGHGTGLGLSISKRIVEQHKGTINFESNENLTTFFITLPIDAS
ncbi:PAS domain-containing sensor histidine kinase [Pigmentibacter ruber]|uniref:PAS domain-containing sensor histidine kinase n=1 Tax=Pigmentibacter ruber TaxID=2683196 RepID=UPI00131C39F0|nr:PAS domain-containing sensor histidine kinase [Pigmentibacter ruber]